MVLQEHQDERREGSIFSSVSADSLSADGRTQWRIIRKELESKGLTLAIIDKNRELIVNCLATALNSDRIQDQCDLSTAESTDKDKPFPSVVSTSNDLATGLLAVSVFEATAESQRPVAKKSAISNEEARPNSSKTESRGFKQRDSALEAHSMDRSHNKVALTKPRTVKLANTMKLSESQPRLSFLSALRGQWFRHIPDSTGCQRSEMIDKQIALASVEQSRVLKVLLLGLSCQNSQAILFRRSCPAFQCSHLFVDRVWWQAVSLDIHANGL